MQKLTQKANGNWKWIGLFVTATLLFWLCRFYLSPRQFVLLLIYVFNPYSSFLTLLFIYFLYEFLPFKRLKPLLQLLLILWSIIFLTGLLLLNCMGK